jgi:site-specific recombinase XerD
MMKVDIHHYDRRIEAALRNIKNGNHNKSNKKILYEFYEYLVAEGLSKGRIAKYLWHLMKISEWMNKSFKKANKTDVIKLIQVIENQKYTAHTKHDYKIVVKRFFKWLRGSKNYPDEVEWIKTTIKETNTIIPDELLTEEDINKLIEVAKHPRDKAMIAFLYESGCRVGELLSLQIRHVVFDEFGAIVTLNGKTGMRKIMVVSSVPHLSTWIENHPFNDTSDSPLWIAISNHNRSDPVLYPNFRRILNRLGRKAKINKKMNPHAFRHSRATHMASHLTEAQMNNYFGWVQGSKMAGTYVHMSGRDMKNAILKMNGLKSKEEVKQAFSPKKCKRCEMVNSPTGKFCMRCGSPLDIKTVISVEKKMKESNEIMTALLKDLLKDPGIQSRIENKLEHMKIEAPIS